MSYQDSCEICNRRSEDCECPPDFPYGVVSPEAVYGGPYGGPAKKFWHIPAMPFHPVRFACAECGYDAMVGEPDRGTWRYDCAFCGWGCFHDHLGWWHEKTSQEWEQEAYEELFE